MLKIEFLEELKNNLDGKVENFLNEISTHLNNSKEKVSKDCIQKKIVYSRRNSYEMVNRRVF